MRERKGWTYLLCIGVRNSSFVHPVGRFAIFGIVNFLRWVDRRLEILQKVAFLFAPSIDQNLIGIIRANESLGVASMIEKEKPTDLTMRV